MIKSIKAKDFQAVPYLETSLLMQHHPEGIQFSMGKPTVIVGPNGAGKSALMTALALRTLSYYLGESAFDNNYVNGRDVDKYWTEEGWNEYTFLKGLTCKTDNAPAVYYRPGHIPGNETSLAHALVCGYSKQADEHHKLVDEKSSGQQCQALLQKVQKMLSGKIKVLAYRYVNWTHSREPEKIDRRHYTGSIPYKVEALKKLYSGVPVNAKPVILMDEPEQSLDAKAEALLWKQIAEADSRDVQVIVATHSLYPLLHPEKFALIEAVPGYIKEVQALI